MAGQSSRHTPERGYLDMLDLTGYSYLQQLKGKGTLGKGINNHFIPMPSWASTWYDSLC